MKTTKCAFKPASSKLSFSTHTTSVTNIVSTNISPRIQKEIIGFIGKNVGKHWQYIGKIKNTKILKNTKIQKITIYSKKSPKNWGKYRGDILPIYRQ